MTNNNEQFKKDLYTIECGNWCCIDTKSSYTRVPGGWVYSNMQGSCFIPFDNEFMPRGKNNEKV